MVYVFWTLAILISYPYLLYPGLLFVCSCVINRRVEAGAGFPSVTIIIPAYNEESVIREKIENSLNLDYPHDLLEVIVVSDASDDKTDEITGRFNEQGVHLIRNSERKGKTFGLNRAANIAKGEVLVFTDADSMFESLTLQRLVKSFADPDVGLVTGCTRYFTLDDNGSLVSAMGFYSRFEKWLKERESRVSSCVGADGAVFALRKVLYKPLDEKDINDFVIPLEVVRQGRRVIFGSDVYCLERHTHDDAEEFNRQIRIANRTIRALLTRLDLMNPLMHGLFAWMLCSHKLLRFLLPWFAIGLFIINFILLFNGNIFFKLTFALYPLISIAFMLSQNSGRSLPALLRSFINMNLAFLCAWIKVFRKQTIVVWSK
jgi:cellulose synthase/poly-beta-1,6-N-acetylglucosamine synthase-like glycosyltransferase